MIHANGLMRHQHRCGASSAEPLVAAGQWPNYPRHLVADQAQRVDDLTFALGGQPADRYRCTDRVLRGPHVVQCDGEASQPRRVLLVVGGIAPDPGLFERLVERGAVGDGVRGERCEGGREVGVAFGAEALGEQRLAQRRGVGGQPAADLVRRRMYCLDSRVAR